MGDNIAKGSFRLPFDTVVEVSEMDAFASQCPERLTKRSKSFRSTLAKIGTKSCFCV